MIGREIRAICLAIVCALALIAVESTVAVAAPVPGALSMRISDDPADSPVFDGTDVFWIEKSENLSDLPIRDDFVGKQLRKRSFFDATAVSIASVPDGDDVRIDELMVGGGMVAFRLVEGDLATDRGVTTKIVRMSADGTNQAVLASGQLKNPVSHDPPAGRRPDLLDCGTEVSLSDVSPSGEVVFASVVRTRKGSACGGSENSNEWTFTGVKPDATSRLILASKATVVQRIERKRGKIVSIRCNCDRGWRSVQVKGDWALVSIAPSSTSSSAGRLVNLTTGMWSSRYGVGDVGRWPLVKPSFDHTGRVAVFGAGLVAERKRRGEKRHYSIRTRSVSFPNPGSTAERVPLSRSPFAVYCGARLMAFYGAFEKSTLVQIDPSSGALIRRYGQPPSLQRWSFSGCSPSHIYLSRRQDGAYSIAVTALPLD